MTARLYTKIRILLISLVMLSGAGCVIYSQTRISGVINKYGRVTEIGADYVIVGDPAQFAQFSPGDTVLLMQMKGVRIYSFEDAIYGTPESSNGPTGKYEFIRIKSTESSSGKIVFRNNIVNPTFNTEGDVQIIKVPLYNNAVVEGTLSSQPWDSTTKTGGVLSIIAGNTLSLNADIDVTGKGFRGGTSCMGTSICVGTNPTRFDKYAFHRDSLNSGFKGESLVIRGWLAVSDYPAIYPKYAKGKGPSSTGGGGGNGKYSGGGGGGNYGSGGKGGREVINCTGKPVDGGTGGLQIRTTPLAGGLFLGGGGGSSTGLTDISASPGGNGGGIVIILCDTITGNGYRIVADGADASDATDKTGGAGGGGGGGSVALHLRSFTTSGLTISVNGGKGGNSLSTHGEGGGGGGGLINTSNITTPTGIIKNYSGGAVGTRTGASTGGSGTAGENLTTFVPVLNGFLFNSVSSSVNGKQVDTIISNEIPRTLSGTYPAGGSGSYTYVWQKSYINPDAPFTISGVNTSSYTPTDPETTTVWFRRIVTDNATLLSDTSKWLKIVVMIPTQSPQMNFSKNLIMFPNPANDEFEIRLSDQRTGDVEIILTDINGSRKSSWRTVKESEELRYKIPASGFAAGLYHIRLLIDNTPYCSGRVVIVH